MNRALMLILGLFIAVQPAFGMVSLRQRFSALVPMASAFKTAAYKKAFSATPSSEKLYLDTYREIYNGTTKNRDGLRESSKMFMHHATQGGSAVAVQQLLWSKIQPDIRDAYGVTALMLAAEKGDLETMRILIAKKAQVNARDKGGNTPLHYAVQGGSKEAAALLLQHKANLSKANTFGRVPFEYAQNITMIELLQAQQEKQNYWQRFTGFMRHMYRTYSKKIFGSVISAGVIAKVSEEKEEEVDEFLQAFASNNWKRAHELAPRMAQDRLDSLLFEVVNQEQEYENVEQVKRLFDLGARVTVLPSGVTVLHAAALNGHSKVLQYLCQAGTNPNIPHKRSDELNGSTPAHYAAMNCHQAAIEELRQHGADLMLKNGTGKTPIDYWKQCAKN